MNLATNQKSYHSILETSR